MTYLLKAKSRCEISTYISII